MLHSKECYDVQHKNTQHDNDQLNNTQRNATQSEDIQSIDTQHSPTQHNDKPSLKPSYNPSNDTRRNCMLVYAKIANQSFKSL